MIDFNLLRGYVSGITNTGGFVPSCNPCGKEVPVGRRSCSRRCASKAYRTAEFISRIASSEVVTDENGCWVWPKRKYKYGPHRSIYTRVVGPVPQGKQLDHLCNNTRCVNPWHLSPSTHRDNTLRGTAPTAVNARKTHCPKGHEYTPQNTIVHKDKGWRSCRTCRNAKFRVLNKRRAAYLSEQRRNLPAEKKLQLSRAKSERRRQRRSREMECVVCGTLFLAYRGTTCSRKCRGVLSHCGGPLPNVSANVLKALQREPLANPEE